MKPQFSQKKQLKIAHDLDDFQEGQEIILTLQDQPIINPNNKKDYELNDAPDILENINLKEKEEFDYNQKMKDEIKQKKLGGYSYEDKFSIEKKLLPQYDDERPQKQGIYLDDQGEYDAQKIDKIQQIKNKFLKKNKNEIQLYQDRKIQSEYYDEKEEMKFKVPAKKFKRQEKNKKLVDILEENAEEENQDHGSRKLQIIQARQQEQIEGNLQKKVKISNYENALEKAQQDINKHQDKSNYKLFFEEEQDELDKAIEKQRKIQSENSKNQIEILLQNNSKLENPESRRLSSQDFNKIIESEKSTINGKQVLNTLITTTDFLKNIQTQIEQQEIKQKIIQPTKYGISDTKEGTTSVVNISLPSEKMMNFCRNSEAVSTFGYQSAFNRQFYSKTTHSKNQPQSLIKEPQPKQQPEEEEVQNQQQSTDQLDDENDEELLEKYKEELQCLKEDNIGTGLAKTLEFLRQRGDLIDEGREYAGRARDKTQYQEEGKYGPKREGMGGEKLDLEYRDDNGRIMTPKEAFRYLCWIFHGKKPGKNKIDKKMKKQQLEQKAKFSDPQNTPLLKALSKQTNKTNQPYMVLGQIQQSQQF